jgi:hypothetical protein
MTVVPETQHVEAGRLWLKTSLGKVRTRPYLTNKSKGLGHGPSGRALAEHIGEGRTPEDTLAGKRKNSVRALSVHLSLVDSLSLVVKEGAKRFVLFCS